MFIRLYEHYIPLINLNPEIAFCLDKIRDEDENKKEQSCQGSVSEREETVKGWLAKHSTKLTKILDCIKYNETVDWYFYNIIFINKV